MDLWAKPEDDIGMTVNQDVCFIGHSRVGGNLLHFTAQNSPLRTSALIWFIVLVIYL
jgi:hypothetical protein